MEPTSALPTARAFRQQRLRSLVSAVILVANLMLPILCMGGALEHPCECGQESTCGHQCDCGHENDCCADPCDLGTLPRSERGAALSALLQAWLATPCPWTSQLCSIPSAHSLALLDPPDRARLPYPPTDRPLRR